MTHYLKALFCILFGCITCCSGAIPPSATGMPEIALTVFISLDGFRPDYIELYPEETLHLQRLIAGGVRVATCEGVFPSTTTTNMTSLVTGAFPSTTTIGNNMHYVRETDELIGGPRDNQADTIAEMLSAAGLQTASVNHFMLENRGVHHYVQGNMTQVIDLIRNKKVDFVAYYHAETDTIGHRHGPFSPEMRATVARADAEIGALISALEEMDLFEKTLITVNSDHGMSPFEAKNAEPDTVEALRSAGFQVADGRKGFDEDPEVIVIAAGSRLIYIRKPLSQERETLLVETLESIRGARLLKRADLDALRAHNNRSGDYALVPLDGYTLSHAGAPGGQHGRPAEKDTFLILHGPGIRQGVQVEFARTVDIVPTLLAVLGVAPSETVDGTVIQEALTYSQQED